jgi:hypothetical protein
MERIGGALEQARFAAGVGKGRSESSKDQASGEALELEAESKRSILGDIAAAAESFEHRLSDMVARYRSVVPDAKNRPRIAYAKEFDTRAFEARVKEHTSFQAIGLSPEVDTEGKKQLVRERFSTLSPERLEELVDSMKEEDSVNPLDLQRTEVQSVAEKNRNQGGPKPGQGNGGPKPPGKATGA